MQKIVITGGLGYIGTELCKLYSGESWSKKIIVLDNRFVSERVSQLRSWGMEFIQCSILEKEKISQIVKDADVVYHLAGVTDVAYTKTQSNQEKDKEIIEYGINGTRNIINNIKKDCKFIFPSTHVVYEGLESTMFDIEESYPVRPVLTYSNGKVQSELDIKDKLDNYIILRLGSVYGYSTDTMRINIMPNLFSKIASQDGTISLFSGGVQYKSLVNLIDVVRAMKFFAESNIKNETYHLSNENMTIRDVAEICKKFNPKVKILETDDEIPNLGYTLSNKKILNAGFKFLYNIEDSISEMISKWSKKDINPSLEYVEVGKNEFIDNRGKISNYELTEPINLIGYIESKAGSVRANHYHPIQEQKCLLIKGKYISVTKDLLDESSTIETRVILEGDMAIIKPNVAHTMVFLEDSIFLNLVRGDRDHDNYGITHTIPYILVDNKFKNDLLLNYKQSCRSCGNKRLKDLVSLGLSPLANNLKEESSDVNDTYPLELKYCNECKNVQLSYIVPPKKMFDNYLYVSSTAQSFRKHFSDAAKLYRDKFNLGSKSLVIDIGSNDGVFLKPLSDMDIPVLGIEPAENIAKIANDNGIPTINKYFDEISTSEILNEYGKSDIITASNVFAHSDELIKMSNIAFQLLKDEGSFIVEVQYLLDTMSDMTFDNIYHEHVNYWSVISINNFFNNLGYKIYDVEHIDTHGGSIRVYVSKNIDIKDSVRDFINKEIEFGLDKYETYKTFEYKLINIKKTVNKNINILKNKYKRIAAYGSPAKATTALNYFGIGSDVIEYTIEDNLLKKDKWIPGVNIPIRDKKYCMDNLPNLIIVLAWNFFDEIKKNNQDLIEMGVQFISIKDLQKDEG